MKRGCVDYHFYFVGAVSIYASSLLTFYFSPLLLSFWVYLCPCGYVEVFVKLVLPMVKGKEGERHDGLISLSVGILLVYTPPPIDLAG